jgi:hypothetical protein
MNPDWNIYMSADSIQIKWKRAFIAVIAYNYVQEGLSRSNAIRQLGGSQKAG